MLLTIIFGPGGRGWLFGLPFLDFFNCLNSSTQPKNNAEFPQRLDIVLKVSHCFMATIRLAADLTSLTLHWYPSDHGYVSLVFERVKVNLTMFNIAARRLLATSLRAKPRNPLNCLPSRTIVTVKEVKVLFSYLLGSSRFLKYMSVK